MVLFAEHDFKGKNKKLAPKWLGPAEIVNVSDTNIKIRCKNNRTKHLNVKYIKLFNLENANHKNFNDADDDFETKHVPPQHSPTHVTTSKPQQPSSHQQQNQNRPLTRSLTRLLHEHHSINFVTHDLKQKLSDICVKLYRDKMHLCHLPEEERLLWQSYDVDDIMFFLTGQRNIPDFSQYLRVPNLPQQKEIFHNPPPLTPEIKIANGNEQFSTPPPSPSTDNEEFHTPNNSSSPKRSYSDVLKNVPSNIRQENILPQNTRRVSKPPQRLQF